MHSKRRVLYICIFFPYMLGAVVAKWSGHRPGNRKIPGSMPGIDPWLLLCFLGQETYPSPSHPAVKVGHNCVCVTGHS